MAWSRNTFDYPNTHEVIPQMNMVGVAISELSGKKPSRIRRKGDSFHSYLLERAVQKDRLLKRGQKTLIFG